MNRIYRNQSTDFIELQYRTANTLLLSIKKPLLIKFFKSGFLAGKNKFSNLSMKKTMTLSIIFIHLASL